MRFASLFVVVGAAAAVAGCAHRQTVYQVGRHGEPAVAVGERHGDQIWMYDGAVAFVDARHHVRLPSFQDAVLRGDRLYMSPQGDERNVVVTAVGFGGAAR